MQGRFDDSFRNAGFNSFYRTKAMAKKDMARDIGGGVASQAASFMR